MRSKKIIIISRAIYPANYPRSFRATELAIEMARCGHDVSLYGVLGRYDYKDFEKKYNVKIKNICKPLFSTLNSDGKSRNSFLDEVLHRALKRPLEFPDIELAFHIPRILRTNRDVDLLISVAIPFPLHWGCALAKQMNSKKFPHVWVADCGDPYMGNFVSNAKPFFYFKYIEKWFCKHADYLSVPIKKAQDGYYKEFHSKIKVIPQGFRFDLKRPEVDDQMNPIPTFAYAGTFYSKFRDPTRFLDYLCTLATPFKFVVFTNTKSLLSPFSLKLGKKLEIRDYLPRDVLLSFLCKMDFLVNFDNGTTIQSPSKLIDYALSNRPILSLTSAFNEQRIFEEFMQKDYRERFIVQDLKKYHISNVVDQFIKLVDI